MADRLLFAVGNATYEDAEFSPLDFAVTDAKEVFETLTIPPVGLFNRDKSQIRYDLPLQEVRDALRMFMRETNRDDLIVVYVACHGVKRPSGLYLVMRDTLKTELATTALFIDELVRPFQDKESRSYVIILDCCNAGEALTTPGVRARGMFDDFDLDRLTGLGKIVIAAASRHQNAYEVSKLGHSIFTHYFLDGVTNGHAAPVDHEYVTIRDLFDYICNKMKSEHSEIYQQPVYSGQDERGGLPISRNPAGRFSVSALRVVEHNLWSAQFIERFGPGDGYYYGEALTEERKTALYARYQQTTFLFESTAILGLIEGSYSAFETEHLIFTSNRGIILNVINRFAPMPPTGEQRFVGNLLYTVFSMSDIQRGDNGSIALAGPPSLPYRLVFHFPQLSLFSFLLRMRHQLYHKFLDWETRWLPG